MAEKLTSKKKIQLAFATAVSIVMVFIAGWLAQGGIGGGLYMISGMVALCVLFAVIATLIFKKMGKMGSAFIQIFPAQVVWSATIGQPIYSGQLNAFFQAMAGGPDKIITQVLDVIDGQIQGTHYKVAIFRASRDVGANIAPFIETVFQLPTAIQGTVVFTKIGDHVGFGGSETNLESIDFNKQTILRATSKQLAFQVFSPDFMDWYLRTEKTPALMIDGDQGVMMFLGMRSAKECQPAVEHVLEAIIKSGALEKNP